MCSPAANGHRAYRQKAVRCSKRGVRSPSQLPQHRRVAFTIHHVYGSAAQSRIHVRKVSCSVPNQGAISRASAHESQAPGNSGTGATEIEARRMGHRCACHPHHVWSRDSRPDGNMNCIESCATRHEFAVQSKTPSCPFAQVKAQPMPNCCEKAATSM